MSYAVSGKLAGLGRLHPLWGMGDAASDAYAADHAAWLQEKAAYDKAVAAYAGQSAGNAMAYASAQAGYLRDLSAWQAESTAYQNTLNAGNTAARAAGVVTPPGYPGCVTQAQHDAWQAACSYASQTVKGLGADPTGSSCALALLPVCPAPLRPQPTPPPVPAAPAPVPPLRPEPQPPVITAPAAPTPAVAPAATKSGGMLSNGLIIVVLAAGGYALYRTFKKPKAA